jgi:hypothetical protein
MTSIATISRENSDLLERVVIHGDLSRLSPVDKVLYYNRICETVGLNPLTKPFEYIRLQGREVLYATKGAAEQLRQIHGISITIQSREMVGDVYVVTAQAKRIADGRVDESTGVISVSGLKGEGLANAMMKAETKAKRRVSLSICGLSMLDESEVESIPEAKVIDLGVSAGTEGGPQSKTRKIAALLRAKMDPKEVVGRIERASSVDELMDAAKDAKLLDAESKAIARTAYIERKTALEGIKSPSTIDVAIEYEGERETNTVEDALGA